MLPINPTEPGSSQVAARLVASTERGGAGGCSTDLVELVRATENTLNEFWRWVDMEVLSSKLKVSGRLLLLWLSSAGRGTM